MKYSIIIFSILLSFACKKQSNESLEKFYEFNSKFHSDSIFQMQRINFPIEGNFKTKFTVGNWSEKNWKMLRKPFGAELPANFEHKIIEDDEFVAESIYMPNGKFKYETKFKIIKGKWYLIYFDKIDLH